MARLAESAVCHIESLPLAQLSVGTVFLALKTGEQDANAEAAFIAVFLFLFLFSAPECLRSTLWFKNVPFKCPPRTFQ